MIDLNQTMRAEDWAKEFMRITNGNVDEETMIVWFANAIVCGWDHYYWTTPKYKQAVKDALNEVES